jgi:hypothetical protein
MGKRMRIEPGWPGSTTDTRGGIMQDVRLFSAVSPDLTTFCPSDPMPPPKACACRRPSPRLARSLVELLSSMRFAISLLTVICIASVIGTVLKQHEPAVQLRQPVRAVLGPAVPDALKLNAVYSAWWFLLILAFLVTSTSLCIARQAPKIFTDLRTLPRKACASRRCSPSSTGPRHRWPATRRPRRGAWARRLPGPDGRSSSSTGPRRAATAGWLPPGPAPPTRSATWPRTARSCWCAWAGCPTAT